MLHDFNFFGAELKLSRLVPICAISVFLMYTRVRGKRRLRFQDIDSHIKSIRGQRMRVTKTIIIFVILITVGLIIASSLLVKQNIEAKPNVILISVDTLRWDHCSAYGYSRETTPTIGKLANAGCSFSCTYSSTSSTCPSHATMFTSLHPITHGIIRNDGSVLNSSMDTMAELFKINGYQTAGIVSSFALNSKFGFSQGFDFYDDILLDEQASISKKIWHKQTVDGVFDQRAGTTLRKVVSWLNHSRARKHPFFLFIHFFDPHAPYQAPEPYYSKFGSDTKSRYDGEIAYVDDCIKTLIVELERLSLDTNTLVVIVGDHGEGLGNHGWQQHGKHLYDEAIRVPYIYYWPGHTVEGQMFSFPVDLLTLAPTILDLVGISYKNHGFQGNSLYATVFDGEIPLESRTIFFESRDVVPPKSGVRMGDYKYIELFSGKKKWFFDLKNDPKELNNIYDDNKTQAEALRSKLLNWKQMYTREVTDDYHLSVEDKKKFQLLGYLGSD